MSCGSPRRFNGIRAASCSPKLSTSTAAKSVTTRPGAMPTTRVGPSSDGQLAGHVDQCGFGEVVDPQPTAVGPQSPDRSDVDDRARPILERLLPGRLGPQQRSLEVDLERLVVTSLVDVECPAVVRVRGGVVDEDVEPTEPFDRGADGTLAGIGVTGIRGEDLDVAGHLGASSLELILLATVDHHLRARRCQRCRDRLADALRGAGDQRNLAVQ